MVPLLVVALVMGRLEFVEGLGDEVGRVELDLLVCLALSQRNFCCGSFFLGYCRWSRQVELHDSRCRCNGCDSSVVGRRRGRSGRCICNGKACDYDGCTSRSDIPNKAIDGTVCVRRSCG
jgi:hypothetical protein